METFSIKTGSKTELQDITGHVNEIVSSRSVRTGTCTVYVPHTTAAVTINESADPSVRKDIIMELNSVIPFKDGYSHMEGNSAAHIKSTIVGESVTIIVDEGRLSLGRWQGIFFCEFDGPRTRQVHVLVRE
ncbi:MAG: secondary thiamine-phosphate synthase enzyme YjbQ [Planctomycetota bacterium]